MRILRRVNEFAHKVRENLGKKVVAVRVFTNCLCVYFENGATRFFSKMNMSWGKVGSVYFVTDYFRRESLPSKLSKEFQGLIEWTQYWVDGTANKLWLTLEYNIKHRV